MMSYGIALSGILYRQIKQDKIINHPLLKWIYLYDSTTDTYYSLGSRCEIKKNG